VQGHVSFPEARFRGKRETKHVVCVVKTAIAHSFSEHVFVHVFVYVKRNM